LARLLRLLTAASLLAGALALEGCGRKGYPEAPSTAALPSNSPEKLPRGISEPALKAGATKQPTLFDFLL
jgi:predicted small lipoprotein YifL